VRAVPAGFAARAPRVREGDGDQGSEKGQMSSRDLFGDLLGAKNAGVTASSHQCGAFAP
jgi:hypothetical protein